MASEPTVKPAATVVKGIPKVVEAAPIVSPHEVTSQIPHGMPPAQVYRQHTVKIVDHSKDPSQVFPYLIDCSCGFQGRVVTLDDAKAMSEQHISIAKIRSYPRF